MSIRHWLAAVRETASRTKYADALGSPSADHKMSPEEREAHQHRIMRALLRGGAEQRAVAPLVDDLPQADPAILQSVVRRARAVRDPADYTRLLSHSKDVNEIARMSALPAMLLADALLPKTFEGAERREQILDVLSNLQMPAEVAARGPDAPRWRGNVSLSAHAQPYLFPR